MLILLGASIAAGPHLLSIAGPRWFLTDYAFAAALWLFLRGQQAPRVATVVIAVVLRLAMFASEPQLSGDVYRYLWDGSVSRDGRNPYAYAPDDERLRDLRKPWHAKINHPEIATIYPPQAELLFAVAPRLTLWRLILLTGDIAVVLLLPPVAAFAFALCPLSIFEGVWSGHVDALAGALLAIAVLRRSGIAAGIAGGLKLIPFAAVPPLLRQTTRRRRFALACAAAVTIPLLPFLHGPLMPGLRDYATRWIFNSPFYRATYAVIDVIPTRAIWTHHPLRFAAISDLVYRHLYTDFLTRVVLATLAIGAILTARRATTAVGWLLLCSPAIHPWYWLTLLPVAVAEGSFWAALALCAPFSYLLYTGTAERFVFTLCYLLPLVMVRGTLWRAWPFGSEPRSSS